MSLPGPPGWARFLLAALSLLAIAAFLFTALSRIGYPYELEFMTGACLDHVDRILEGKKVYVAPSSEFVTWLYGPLYFYAGALGAVIAGESSLVVLRTLSLGSALVTTLLSLVIVWRATRSAWASITAAGLWASTYGIVGTWWDIGRVDSMFVAWTAIVLAILWHGKTTRSAIVAGALMTVAFMAKQTALVIAPAFAVATALLSLRRGLAFGATFAVTLLPSLWILDWIHDGWFMFYVWDTPRSHGHEWEAFWEYVPGDTLAVLPMFAVTLWYILRLACTHRMRRALFAGAWCGGLLLATWLSRAHVGGAENVVIPTHFGLALIAGLALGESVNSRFWRVAIPAVLVVQFALSAYDPRHYLPTQADRAAGDRLLEALRSSEGPAMMPVHGGYQRRTGHAPSAHVLAVMDIERGPDPELGKRLRAEFLAHSWSADCDLIVLNEPGAEDYGALLVRDPNKIEWRFEPLFDDPKNPDGTPQLQENGRPVFMPVVGLQTRPMQVWRRIR